MKTERVKKNTVCMYVLFPLLCAVCVEFDQKKGLVP